jgi:hypothetical protein
VRLLTTVQVIHYHLIPYPKCALGMPVGSRTRKSLHGSSQTWRGVRKKTTTRQCLTGRGLGTVRRLVRDPGTYVCPLARASGSAQRFSDWSVDSLYAETTLIHPLPKHNRLLEGNESRVLHVGTSTVSDGLVRDAALSAWLHPSKSKGTDENSPR